MKKNNHTVSNALFAVGAVFTFLGFIWPGWLWVLNTPGDVEMLSMAVITVVGMAGVLSLIAGGFRRFCENRSDAAERHDAQP